MSVNIHLTRIYTLLATFWSDADLAQLGILTNSAQELVYKNNDNTRMYFTAQQKYTLDGADFTYCDNDFRDVNIRGDIYVAEYIYHLGNTLTYRRFETNKITDTVGGIDFLNMVEDGTQDIFEVNPGQNDIDFIVNTSGLEAFNINGATGNALFAGTAQILRLGIGTAASATVKALISLDDATVYSASMALPLTVAQIRNEDTTQLSSALLGFYSAKGSNIWNIGAVGSAASYQGSFVIGNRTAANVLTERVSILQSGFVGLGASIPESLLALWSTSPTLTLHNTTEENIDAGRESIIDFRGEQDGTEISTLARIRAQHDGVGDDQKGELIFYVNNGTDDDAPAAALAIDSVHLATFSGAISAAGAISGGAITAGGLLTSASNQINWAFTHEWVGNTGSPPTNDWQTVLATTASKAQGLLYITWIYNDNGSFIDEGFAVVAFHQPSGLFDLISSCGDGNVFDSGDFQFSGVNIQMKEWNAALNDNDYQKVRISYMEFSDGGW